MYSVSMSMVQLFSQFCNVEKINSHHIISTAAPLFLSSNSNKIKYKLQLKINQLAAGTTELLLLVLLLSNLFQYDTSAESIAICSR